MPRRALLGVGAYIALAASLFTPLYDPFLVGDAVPWPPPALLIAAHVGLGAAVARPWAFAAPVALGVAAVAVDGVGGAEPAATAVAVAILMALTGLGWAAAALPRGPDAVPAAAFAIATVPAVCAAVVTIDRAWLPHVPAELRAQLPLEASLGNLCPGAETPRSARVQLERQAEVLLQELRRRPNDLVPYTYRWAHGGSDTKQITVRELAEEQLMALEDAGCAGRLERRIERALAAI